MKEKINPFIDTGDIKLEDGELLTYLNCDIGNIKIKNTYMVSSKGRIFSYNNKEDKLIEMKPSNNNNKKYYRLNVQNINNKRCTISVHRAVLSSFNPIEDMYNLTVNHKDGNKSNNSLDNLEWTTNIENIHHACDNGLRENSDSLTDNILLKVIEFAKQGLSDIDISKLLSIKLESVKNIRSGHGYMKNRLKILNLIPINKITRITDEIIIKVMELAKEGYSDIAIANELGLKYNTVKNIRVGRNGRFDKRLEKLNLKPIVNEEYINKCYRK